MPKNVVPKQKTASALRKSKELSAAELRTHLVEAAWGKTTDICEYIGRMNREEFSVDPADIGASVHYGTDRLETAYCYLRLALGEMGEALTAFQYTQKREREEAGAASKGGAR